MPFTITATGPSSPRNDPSVVTFVSLPHALQGFDVPVMTPSSGKPATARSLMNA
jgi:hypothetical protein